MAGSQLGQFKEKSVSEDPHGATTIRASKGGGASKWLIGGVAAVVLAGGAYGAWKYYSPDQDRTEIAYNDDLYAEEPLRAGPLDSDDDTLAESAATDEDIAAPAPAERRAAAPARRAPARVAAVPEETIGITPVSASADDSDEVVVTGARRPIWARTPSERRLSSLYPVRALERGREGEARLHCTVQDQGRLDCVRVEETPGGFGNAALRVARSYRHAPTLADGSDAAGTPVNLRVVFRIEDDERGQRFASR